jgi:hypothetical protein
LSSSSFIFFFFFLLLSPVFGFHACCTIYPKSNFPQLFFRLVCHHLCGLD